MTTSDATVRSAKVSIGTVRPSPMRRLAQSLRSPRGAISNVHGYTPALVAFLGAITLHWALLNVAGPPLFAGTLFLYVTAIVIGGWCGYGPGILVVLLVFTVPGYLFAPNYSIRSISPSALGLATLLSVLISRAAAWRRQSEAALQNTNEELERRVQEKTAALGEANAALQVQNRELIQANADLEQFAYSASHDLQEPLRMVSLFAQLLKVKYAGSLDAEGKEYIEHAIAGARRMQTLIGGLRAYLTITSTEAPVHLTDTKSVVARCLENLKLLLESTGARCEVGSLPAVRLNEVHLEQLFQNLIANAIKYRSQDVPHIRISAKKDDSNWVFSVQDNGIGIDPQYRDQIFGVFKRLHRSDQYEGAGMGLAICKRIVDRYGGQLWVESKPGAGATFYFTVPQ